MFSSQKRGETKDYVQKVTELQLQLPLNGENHWLQVGAVTHWRTTKYLWYQCRVLVSKYSSLTDSLNLAQKYFSFKRIFYIPIVLTSFFLDRTSESSPLPDYLLPNGIAGINITKYWITIVFKVYPVLFGRQYSKSLPNFLQLYGVCNKTLINCQYICLFCKSWKAQRSLRLWFTKVAFQVLIGIPVSILGPCQFCNSDLWSINAKTITKTH